MAVRDPKTLRSGAQRPVIDGIVDAIRGLYTFTKGNEYLTLGAALQITTAPAGTPVANTVYKDNICKGWVAFNGTGTIAIDDSFNVSGLVDNGVGDYTITWDRDFSAATYSIVGAASAHDIHLIRASRLVGSARINAVRREDALGLGDADLVCVHAFGDQ